MQFLDVFNEFKQLCCNQETQCAVASRVYMDLILDKKYCCINKCYDTTLEVFYLQAEAVDKKKFLILPSLVTKELDLNTIHKLRSLENGSSFLLALCDTSSNILYYRQYEE